MKFRKPRGVKGAGRGRHNRERLRKLNQELAAAELPTQTTLTRAEFYRRQLRTKQRQEQEAKKED